ncbi:hypothetical protein ATCC90586_007150 [Pythium insidiosum]|nr:hypothetical protein ATCC90586_007150 [Pythium insidiosum]
MDDDPTPPRPVKRARLSPPRDSDRDAASTSQSTAARLASGIVDAMQAAAHVALPGLAPWHIYNHSDEHVDGEHPAGPAERVVVTDAAAGDIDAGSSVHNDAPDHAPDQPAARAGGIGIDQLLNSNNGSIDDEESDAAEPEQVPPQPATQNDDPNTDDEDLQYLPRLFHLHGGISFLSRRDVAGQSPGEATYEDVLRVIFQSARDQKEEQVLEVLRITRELRSIDGEEVVRGLVQAEDDTGLSLLMICVRHGLVAACKALVDAGADVNQTNNVALFLPLCPLWERQLKYLMYEVPTQPSRVVHHGIRIMEEILLSVALELLPTTGRMEFLVHNISHSDLIVELSWLRDGEEPAPQHVPTSILARPKFSLFQQTSKAIMDRVEELLRAAGQQPAPSQDVTRADETDSPTGRRAQLHPSLLDIAPEHAGRSRRVRWKAKCVDTQSPIGFKLHECPIPITELQDFRLRGGLDTVEVVQKHWSRVGITAVYFPLIALLIPKWLEVLREVKSERSKQLIYLISGAGIPRNVAHCMQGNSTEITARLIQIFVRQYYPQTEVFQVHSGSNIFRFDDNVQFMTRELRPRLEAHRETIVARCGDAWRAHFHVTIAYADGPPARLSALNASLRIFRPSYLHVWQLKTYWHEQKLSMDDVDFHSFENIEASPSVSLQDADALTQTLVREMRAFRDQFLAGEGSGEIGSFWLRKSRKPVLAVLLIEKTDARSGATTLVAYRGMNCEVSMPTGSLCAERNAIGSALAQDPTLPRHALKMIGVLGINLSGSSRPASAAATNGSSLPRQVSQPTASIMGCLDTHAPAGSDESRREKGALNDDAASRREESSGMRQETREQPPSSPQRGREDAPPKRRHEPNANLSSPRKPKRPRTFSCDDATVEALLLQAAGAEDRNPLAPCGACKEWLLKIAEANPSFRVVTFENARCRNFYINQIM